MAICIQKYKWHIQEGKSKRHSMEYAKRQSTINVSLFVVYGVYTLLGREFCYLLNILC